MGTRASFWIGDPADLDNREWLGCVAWDGHPGNFAELAHTRTRSGFVKAVKRYHERDDFAHPGNGWPFPWDDNVFLTDVTYAFIPDFLSIGRVHVCWFHDPFEPLRKYLADIERGASEECEEDPRHQNVPAPEKYNRR